ncbi:MAG TPA: DUF2442 domain-containing protein [Candidatus Kapabacteria bacterium]|nr:DUF2442 domain-containing protein [Candidatus Kapabacteria bacterium]
MTKMTEIVRATYLHDYVINVAFDDGYEMNYNVELALTGEIGSPLRDMNLFKQFRLEGGALVWPNGFDTCPDYLRHHYELEGAEEHV